VELPVIVSDAVHAARAVEPDRPISLEVHSDGVPLIVSGDDARLRQVVGNLLSNSLTHTPAGTDVAVRLRAEPPVAVIEVADRGPGLTPAQAERVFERFYRVDAARTGRAPPGGVARPGGTGLGLAIVAALVAAHRGTVEVDSVPGGGATFRVRLPLAENGNTADLQADFSRAEE
jgi:two-component system OmpR family sensor kinase